jgi:NTE family protein
MNPQNPTESDTAPVASGKVEREPLLVDFALQGGGSHGAFTWGVLDRLLEERWLNIEAISGTSAGAMNAAVLVDGHAKGGAEGARAALEAFWRSVSDAAAMSPLRRGPIDVLLVNSLPTVTPFSRPIVTPLGGQEWAYPRSA